MSVRVRRLPFIIRTEFRDTRLTLPDGNKFEVRPYPTKGGYSYEIVDLNDTLVLGDTTFPEHIHTETQVWANIETATRNGERFIDNYKSLTPPQKRKALGFTV